MGRDKALLPWPPASTSGQTLLAAADPRAPAFRWNPSSSSPEKIKTISLPLRQLAAPRLAINPAPERGQFSSLQTGLRAAIDRGSEAAMIVPVDNPPLCARSLQQLSPHSSPHSPAACGPLPRTQRPPRPSAPRRPRSDRCLPRRAPHQQRARSQARERRKVRVCFGARSAAGCRYGYAGTIRGASFRSPAKE